MLEMVVSGVGSKDDEQGGASLQREDGGLGILGIESTEAEIQGQEGESAGVGC